MLNTSKRIILLGTFFSAISGYVAVILEDVARGRGNFTTQSGYSWMHLTADLALDGSTDYDTDHCAKPYYYHTATAKAWWMVDLGSEHVIDSVMVCSANKESVEDLLGYISIRVSNSANITDHRFECALWEDATFPRDSCLLLKCDNIETGRYVSIIRADGSSMYTMILCEVMIMSAIDGPAPPIEIPRGLLALAIGMLMGIVVCLLYVNRRQRQQMKKLTRNNPSENQASEKPEKDVPCEDQNSDQKGLLMNIEAIDVTMGTEKIENKHENDLERPSFYDSVDQSSA